MAEVVYQVLEQATARAAEDQPALLSARAEWERQAGIVHDDEPLYEERAAAFLEWYLIDYRAAGGDGRAAIEQQLAAAEPGPAREALSAVAASHRSVFAVREVIASDGVLLEDLYGGGLFRVHERRKLAGLAPGELFDARLIADPASPPQLVFGRTFCFHPAETLEAIRERVARARRDREPREALLFRLLRLRVRCERYRHVSPARVYATDETQA